MNSPAFTVRPLTKEDLAPVAGLFQRTFRDGTAASPALETALRQTFIDHPFADPDLPSHVFVNEAGKVSGFIGVNPARMTIGGREIRAAFAGSMMVERPKENPLAGARLIRAFLSGPQDVSISETANATALGMWRKLGHDLIPAYSMNWLRVFRPGSTGIDILNRVHPAARLLKPFGALADRIARMGGGASFGLETSSGKGPAFQDVGEEELAEALMALAPAFPLAPIWNRPSLGWLLAQAREKSQFGPIVRRVAYGSDGAPVAAHVYYGRPGGIAWVLQSLARPERMEAMVDDMLQHAADAGCAAIRGAGQPWLTPFLLRKKALFLGRSFVVAQTKDPDIRETIDSGKALITGLAGETWSPLIGERFS
ncbi:MAG: hypothetical protein DI528_01370 [Shinella sp.]|nr:MAG: hypothetical protein DI528_01370 [Shinella sp.]